MANFEKDLLEITPLETLLGKERVGDIKDRIADMIVRRIADDLESYDCYLFWPDDYKETVHEAFASVEKKIKKMYSDAALGAAQRAVERFIEDE